LSTDPRHRRRPVARLGGAALVVCALAPSPARAAAKVEFLPSVEAFYFRDGNPNVIGVSEAENVARTQLNLDLESESPTTQWLFNYSIYREVYVDVSDLDNTGMWLSTSYSTDASRRASYDVRFFGVRTERQHIRRETIESPDTLLPRTTIDRFQLQADGRVETGQRSFIRWAGSGSIQNYEDLPDEGITYNDSDSVRAGLGWGYEVNRKVDLGVVYGYGRFTFEETPTTQTNTLDIAASVELGPRTELRAAAGLLVYEEGSFDDATPSFLLQIERGVSRGSSLLFGLRQGISPGTGQGGATEDYGGYVRWNYRPAREYRIDLSTTYWHRDRIGLDAGTGTEGFRTLSQLWWTPTDYLELGVFHIYNDQSSLDGGSSSGDTSYNTGGVNIRWDVRGRN